MYIVTLTPTHTHVHAHTHTRAHTRAHTHTHTIQIAILIGLAEAVGYLSDYFVIESPTQEDTRNAYFYALTISLLSIILIPVLGMAYYYGYFLGMLTRVLFSSVIYQKVRSSQVCEPLLSCSPYTLHTVQFQIIGHSLDLLDNVLAVSIPLEVIVI